MTPAYRSLRYSATEVGGRAGVLWDSSRGENETSHVSCHDGRSLRFYIIQGRRRGWCERIFDHQTPILSTSYLHGLFFSFHVYWATRAFEHTLRITIDDGWSGPLQSIGYAILYSNSLSNVRSERLSAHDQWRNLVCFGHRRAGGMNFLSARSYSLTFKSGTM